MTVQSFRDIPFLKSFWVFPKLSEDIPVLFACFHELSANPHKWFLERGTGLSINKPELYKERTFSGGEMYLSMLQRF
jgi:hypothetical protein